MFDGWTNRTNSNNVRCCSVLFAETRLFDDVFGQNGLTSGNVSEQIRTF
jgi:hypothetical protein